MSHRYRLVPTPEQAEVMASHCAHARFVWNLALEQANAYRPHWGRTPNYTVQCRQLAEARKDSWLGEGSSPVQRGALRDFDRACRRWWAGTHRRPTWRRRGVNEGFAIFALYLHVHSGEWAAVHVPKCGYVRFRLSRPMPSEAKSARITLDRAGRWHVSFVDPQPVMSRTQTGAAVGVDLGVAHGVTTSDGAHTSPKGLTDGERRRLVRLQRRSVRQVKGSNRRERTKLAVARLRAREADRRKDWVEKTSTELVRQYDLIVIEDLSVVRMTRSGNRSKAGLNRSILAVGWSQLRTRIEQKAAAATSPVTVLAVDPRYTSQRCHPCGHVSPRNRESQAFRCVSCGHQAHADVNAARNILGAGLALTGRGGDVRPPHGGGAREASTTNLATARGSQGTNPLPGLHSQEATPL